MRFGKTTAWLSILGLLLAITGLVVACGGGVSQEEFDAAKQQLADQEQKAAALQQQLSDKLREVAAQQQKIASGEGDVKASQEKLATKEKEAAELQKQLEAAKAVPGLPAGASILLAAKPVPAPTPRPTPTPPPAGYVPPPAPVPPASFSEPLALYIRADTVTSAANESKYNVDATGIPNWACVQTSAFKRGMHLVWRYEVVDTATGKRLTDKEMATAAVRLPTGEEIKGRFGRHGSTDDAPWFWTSAWDIPLDYPLGILDWSVQVAAKDGKQGSFKPWAVSIPARAVESRTQILE